MINNRQKQSIEFTNEQYLALMKGIFLGNWVANAYRIDDTKKEYEAIEDYIFSFAAKFGLDRFMDHEATDGERYYPTRAFEEETDVHKLHDEYDEETVWDELAHWLGERDFFERYSEADLIANLRRQLEKLNGFAFSDAEWERFFTGEIANPNQGIEEKTITIQEDCVKNLTRDDGTTKNVCLLQKTSIHDNSLQVINQYATDEGARTNRYQRESFWAGSGLFEYVQLFVISNGTHTKYYSNTTRSEHIREASEGAGRERLSG